MFGSRGARPAHAPIVEAAIFEELGSIALFEIIKIYLYALELSL